MADLATMPSQPRARPAPARFSLVGPLFYYDLVRLARRGRSTLLRCSYALALFGTLYFMYSLRFPGHDLLAAPFKSPRALDPGEMARMVEEFVRAILLVQTAAIFVLTPAYLASAIAEERERRTLELLFATPVTDREIVLGKLLARVTHLGGILLAGLPLLALTQLWGGIDFSILLAAFFATGLNLLSIGSICIFCSAQARTVTEAVIGSYLLTAVAVVLCVGTMGTPVGVFDALTEQALAPLSMPRPSGGPLRGAPVAPPAVLAQFAGPLTFLAFCIGVNGLAILIGAASAIWSLRQEGGGLAADQPRRRKSSAASQLPIPMEGWGPFDNDVKPPSPRRTLPPIGDWPLLWKETYRSEEDAMTPVFERGFMAYWPVYLILVIFVSLTVLHLSRNSRFSSLPGSRAEKSIQLVVVAPLCAWCTVLAFRAASGISRERDCNTLEGLLTLPISRAELLGAKWLGPMLYGRGFAYIAAAIVALELSTGFLHPLGAILLATAIAAHVAFLASVGVWLSLASRTTVWARTAMAMVLLLFLGAGLRAMNTDDRTYAANPPANGFGGLEAREWRMLVAEVGANAPGSWWFLSFSWREFAMALRAGDRHFIAALGVASCGTAAYALAAGMFWLAAWRRFRVPTR